MNTMLALEARLEVAAVGGGKSTLLAPRELGDADEMVAGLVGPKGVLWPGLVAGTVCGRLTRRSVGPVVRRGGLRDAGGQSRGGRTLVVGV